MNRYQIVHSGVHAAIAGICWMVLSHINQLEAYIVNYKPVFVEYKRFAIPLLITILAMLFRVSDKLGTIILEKIPLLSWSLRRMMGGRDFIEGDWPLVVVDMVQQKPLYFGFLTISFKKGQLYVYGNDWKPEGNHALEFQSKQSMYGDRKLQYWYEQGSSLHNVSMRGYTEIYFFPRMELPERHAGKFLDANRLTDIRFYAERKTYRLLERSFTSKDQQFKAAQGLWAKLAPRLGELKAQDITSDFE